MLLTGAAILAAVLSGGLLMGRLTDPPLPVPNVSGKEAVKKLEAFGGGPAELAAEDGARWYIARFDGGIGAVDEAVRRMSEAEGWPFAGKDGAGLFFEKDGDRRVATTRIWNRRDVIVKVRNLH